jgi:serine/threonine protein phosphatase PrpC
MIKCPNCGEESEAGANFCEGCGSTLAAAAAGATSDPKIECPQCHAGPGCIDAQGFCTSCGTRRKADPRDDFIEVISARVAGVCNIGCKYKENQDYMALGTANGDLVLIVCDGVSSSQNSMAGSKAASETARDLIISEVKSGITDPDDTMKRAIHAAQEAICKVPFKPIVNDNDLPPAQATFVGALVQGKRVTVGWVGDSRAYWATRTAARQISVDDSWVNWAVSEGGMTREQAEKDKRAHAILESLGAANDGSNPGVEPDVRTLNMSESGMLLVVSDGFWNYVKSQEHLVQLINQLPAGTDALTLARHLVNFARQAGGHDNITVVVAIF